MPTREEKRKKANISRYLNLIEAHDWAGLAAHIRSDHSNDINSSLEEFGFAAGTTLFWLALANMQTINTPDQIAVVRAFLDKYPNVDVNATPGTRADRYRTPLYMLIANRQWELAKELEARGANLDAALRNFVNPRIVETLMAHPARRIREIIANLSQNQAFCCPLSGRFMLDPVNVRVNVAMATITERDRAFERVALERYLAENEGNPAQLDFISTREVVGNDSAFSLVNILVARIHGLGLAIMEREDRAARAIEMAANPNVTPPTTPPPTSEQEHRKRSDRIAPPTPVPQKRGRYLPPSPGSP